jgi:hypothetical protein
MKTLALLVIHVLTTLAQRAGPGGPPRPADAACICTSDSRQKHKPNIQIKFVYINAPFFIPSARDRFLPITFNTGITEEPTLKKKRSESAGHRTPAVRKQRASRKVNVESAPESGHFVVSYISNHLTATIDPKATFRWGGSQAFMRNRFV